MSPRAYFAMLEYVGIAGDYWLTWALVYKWELAAFGEKEAQS